MLESLPSLSWFFLFAFALNVLVATSILIFKNKTMRVANFLLAINLMGMAFVAIMISLVQSKLILEIPHFYRLPSPLYYLMFPAAYLYVTLILQDRTRLKKKEYLHFIPAIIHLTEMVPFYALDTEDKLTAIQQAFSQNIRFYATQEGWLPPYIHNIIRGALAIIYAVAMWRLLRTSLAKSGIVNHYNRIVIRWLKTFVWLNAVIGIGAIIFLMVTAIPEDIRSLGFHSIFLVTLLIVNFYLFFRPEILYGMPQNPLASDETPTSSNRLSHELQNILEKSEQDVRRQEVPAFIYEYKNQVHEYLLDTHRYLNSDYNLQDLARETSIPRHHLQLLIYKVEARKFNDFINDYRIQYLKAHIEEHGMKNKTLEGLAADSGFSSKATFIRSVKKLTGKTPKDYFHQRSG